MIKKVILIVMLIAIIFIFSNVALKSVENIDSDSKDYYLTNTYNDTGSKNIVTGIYLDYRLFDSIFEASILIISVSGIIYMSKKDDEVL
ncbi:hypothetical protein [Sporosalibacterium faouarense]|uniref:hypothetical protein n=1 Tax=Sporosalibacterium faouarense TaxID=516123 RepID=UPI00141D2374|nr:hypothetical protein [Sporosalibacterium faouarense]MTI48471.1 hypothetical protein [Bacillota bacterium]